MLDLDASAFGSGGGASVAAELDFPTRIPRSFVARMRKGDPSDPLLLQVLAQAAEMEPTPGYGLDPLEESGSMPVPGLLHKYSTRVLVITTGVCPVHCRYCFRRSFPYSDVLLDSDALARMRRYIEQHSEIREIILSGGDPLSLVDDKLDTIVRQLHLPHIRRLRLHTRMPIVIPERIDRSFLRWVSSLPLPLTIVVHCNHANELNGQTAKAFRSLKEAGVVLLNQSVLLRNVNDRAQDIMELSEALFDQGVLPYYLNLLDRISGSSHYAVSIERAREIMSEVQQTLSGYLVPKLVYEAPKASSKVLISIS